jgi:hypothetical protein
MPTVYDLFLSHNSKDKPAVREIAVGKQLRLTPWQDNGVAILEGRG